MGMDFWTGDVWLPPNITWQYFEDDDRFAQFHHLGLPIPMALVLIMVRMAVQQKIFRPLGISLGLKPLEPVTSRNDAVIHGAQKDGAVDSTAIAKKTGLQLRTVERWLRRNRRRTSTLDKFCETGWRWTFYFFIHIAGVCLMWKKAWLWEVTYCWWDFPNHHIDPHIWWYYMVELTFYWSLFFSQFVDVQRKDFWEMFVHHVATIALMVLSWTCHLHRVGSLVLLVHDMADHWLELAKLARYVNYQKVCDVAFAMFAVTWVYTRLALYPTYLIYSTSIEAGQMLTMFPAYYVFNFLLTTLLILHLFWGYFILKVAYKVLLVDDEVTDTRSQSESSSD